MATKWTLMVYMAATDPLLSARVETELDDIRQGLSGKSVRVLVFLKPGGPGVPVSYVEVRPEGDRRKDWDEDWDAASPETIYRFVRWAVEEAPADRYGLIFWGHGSAFREDERPVAEKGEIDTTVWRAASRLFVGRPTEPGDPAGDERRAPYRRRAWAASVEAGTTQEAIAHDSDTGHSLDSDELEDTLKRIASLLGNNIDLLGMDACLMASVEVLSQIRDQADVVVASEHVVTTFGWPYRRILEALCRDPGMSEVKLASTVVDSCVSHYRNKRLSWPVTQCALDCRKWEALSGPLADLAEALHGAVPEHWRDIARAHSRTFPLSNSRIDFGLFDLLSFCHALSAEVPDKAVVEASTALAKGLTDRGAILREAHLLPADKTGKPPKVGGLSVYLPRPPRGPARLDLTSPVGYSDLRFADEIDWSRFLAAYHAAARAG